MLGKRIKNQILNVGQNLKEQINFDKSGYAGVFRHPDVLGYAQK